MSRTTKSRRASKRKATTPVGRRRATRTEPPQPMRSGRVVRTALFAMTLAAGAGLAAYPIGDLVDQREEVDAARDRNAQLQAEVDQLDAELETLTGEEGVEIRGLCFGPYVKPGVETYTVPGVSGCVDHEETSDTP
jgi:cell division protein FtsB